MKKRRKGKDDSINVLEDPLYVHKGILPKLLNWYCGDGSILKKEQRRMVITRNKLGPIND